MIEARTSASLALLCAPLLLAGAVAISLLTASPGGADRGASGTVDDDAEAIFRRDCAQCHGAAGEGTAYGPPLTGAGAALVDYVLSTGRMPIAEPGDRVEQGEPRYDEPTILALSAHVDGFGPEGEPIPEVALSGADVANGGELYRLSCAACHHTAGVGGALVQRAAPAVVGVEPRQVIEAIRTGPFEMPAFGEAALSDADVTDVAAYVDEVLNDPPDRGGWSIWNLGPVPEGAVAIVIGLGALGLLAVWIDGRERR